MSENMEQRVNELGISLTALEVDLRHTREAVLELRQDGRNLVNEIKQGFLNLEQKSADFQREVLKKLDEQRSATDQQITEARQSLERDMKENDKRLREEIDKVRAKQTEHELFIVRARVFSGPLNVVVASIIGAAVAWVVTLVQKGGA